MSELSYQGIADSVAEGYIARHGNVTWSDIAATSIARIVPKAQGLSSFQRCGYVKSARTCAIRGALTSVRCNAPAAQRRLNQTAYSLFFFIRDIPM